jgi:hypothetical protein
MSLEKFNEKKAAIEAIPSEQIVEPSMPVAVYVQEADDLYEWADEDIDLLVNAGLDLNLYKDIPARAAALRYAQSIWQKEYKTYEDAQKEWSVESPAAFDLRDVLVHEMFHAFFNSPDLYSKVRTISEGSGNADMIQDLSDLALLGKSNQEPLKAIGFDLSLLDKAEQSVERLSQLLAKNNGLKMSDNKMKVLRDQAYTYLKQAVDEVRRHGQYKFWRDEDRKKGYSSKYIKLHTKSTKKEVEANTGS